MTSNYTYDQIYELTQVTQAANTTESYSYDPVGNRTSSLGVASYAYNNANELMSTSNATYAYDNNGNTLTKMDSTGTTIYTWDFENRLASIALPGNGGTVSFKYDPLGRRVYKSSSLGTSIFSYDGDNFIEEANASGGVVARYAQGLDTDDPLAMLRAGATSFYNTDGLGSVTSLANAAGSLVQSYTSDSFGKPTASSGSLTNAYRYTSRELDPETSLYYYRARYYDTTTGRFISEDPLEFSAGNNFYDYVNGDVTNLSDPKGLYYSGSDARNAWNHYCDGSGTPWTAPFASIKWDISPIEDKLQAMAEGPCTERSIPVNVNVGISAEDWDFWVIGHHAVKVQGTIQVACNCTWIFFGNMSSAKGFDIYEFPPTGSPFNFVGRNGCPNKGKPFNIYLPGSKQLTEGGSIHGKPTCPSCTD